MYVRALYFVRPCMYKCMCVARAGGHSLSRKSKHARTHLFLRVGQRAGTQAMAVELFHSGPEHLQGGPDEGEVGRVHAAAAVGQVLELAPLVIQEGRCAIARAEVDAREEHCASLCAAAWVH